MANTTNLGLRLTSTGEITMNFLDWRSLMNGENCDSNMELIDAAIGQINETIEGKADGFSFNPDTGVLRLTSGGEPLDGTFVTINLSNYYTKDEMDATLEELESNLADNDALQAIHTDAVGDVDWLEESRTMTLYNLNGEIKKELTIEGGGGGTGGGTAYSIRILNGMPSTSITAASSAETIINASFYEYYGSDSTGQAGTLDVDYKISTDSEWISLRRGQVVTQGVSFALDVTNILAVGKTTNVRLTVTGGESLVSRTLTYNVTSVEASIAAVNFDSTAVYTGNVSFQYRCMGRNLQKTVYFYIDGELYATEDIGTSHNETRTQIINMVGNYTYGAHDCKVYFATPDGAMSNTLKFPILYNDNTSTEPMIGVTSAKDEVTYGDTIDVGYVVYTPGQESTDMLTIRVYAIEEGEEHNYLTNTLTNIPNSVAYEWHGTIYPPSGTAYIEFVSGNTRNVVSLTINEIQSEYDLNQISTNLVYQYSAAGRSNNDSNKALYTCPYSDADGNSTDIKAVFEDFNWVSDGYIDGESLTLSGSARHIIKLPMFSTSYVDEDGNTVKLENAAGATVTTNGRTFEIDFKVTNVTDINAVIMSCMSNEHAGFKVTPQNCYLLYANGADVALDATGFIENEDSIAAAYIKDGTRIRLSFVIEPRGSVQFIDTDGTPVTGQCINIFINGQYANSYVYADNARFAQTEYITLGSNTCILNVYETRIYNRGLTASEVMQNYKASPLSVQDRIARFEDNDVLTDDGDVDYYKARDKYNCLLITGQLSAYKGANGIRMSGKTESGLILTKPDGNGGFTTEFSLMGKDSYGNWVSSNNVQGTSSVKFPIKNYKVYLVKNVTAEDGTVSTKKVKYSLKGKDENGDDLSIGESTLCFKGDYMSSDHANTFNANLADTLYQDTLVNQDASQGGDPRVQNTVYGFRCLLFRRDDEDSPIEFYADGALNNDKGNNKSFGLEMDGDEGNNTTRQKWEFLNNTEALCSFLTDNFNEIISTSDGGSVKRVEQGLESTYPDQGDLEDEGLTPNYDYIQTLFTWVYQRANFWNASTDVLSTPIVYNGAQYTTMRDYKKAIFLNEFEKHFQKNHTLIYYIFMEFVALCDNRSKNMFMQSLDVRVEQLVDTNGNAMSIQDAINPATGEVNADMIDWENSTFAIWMPVLYDLDSCFGVENSGYMQIPYYADWNYYLNGVQKFNGRESILWLMVEEALAGDIQNKAKELTDRSVGNGALNYESIYDVHIRNNALLICPAVVNRDMEQKFSDPWTEGFNDYSMPNTSTGENYTTRHISTYKYMQRGSRTEQKDAFVYRRANMLYSKYKCNKFLNNNINFRVGTNGGVLATESGITIKANQALYPAVKFGDGDAAVISAPKTPAGTPVVITKPGTTASDKVGFSDTVYIAGGTLLTDIGDISKFRPYEVQLQNATGLSKLTIGSSEAGYQNAQLNGIDTSGCKLLEEINLEGCVALTGSINLTRNGLITRVFASGCGASSIMLPNGGILEELHLGAVADIEILNHTNLTTFTCDGYDNLTMLRVENTPNVPVMDMIRARLPQMAGGLRLVGIDVTLDDTDVLDMLVSASARGKYIDNSGVLSDDANAYPYIAGTIHINTIGSYLLSRLQTAYPYLTIDYTNIITQYEVKFQNWDGTLLDTQYVVMGGSAVDPITRATNPIATPTRPATTSSIYTYSAWDTDFSRITGSLTVTATYTETIREYTVRWYSGNTILQTETVLYGEAVTYTGEIPTDTSLEEYLTFRMFDGWDKSTSYIIGDTDVHARYAQAVAPKISDGKTLATMTPAELNALVKTGVLASNGGFNAAVGNADYYGMITSGDEFDIVMGNDMDFDNVESEELVSLDSPRIFDGTNYYNTGIRLFDEDKSFTLAIDFSYTIGAPNSVLASCAVATNGFMLTYSGSNPVITFGGANTTSVAGSTAREMVVIRHRKGDNNLYVYASNKNGTNQMYNRLVRTLPTQHNSTLAFGCQWDNNDNFASNHASGKIYWSKVWFDDLGDDYCKELAAWPRQTYTFQAAGGSDYNFRAFQKVGSENYCNCCFLMKNLLQQTHQMNTESINSGGWPATIMRTWLNSRVLNALPSLWRRIIQQVKVTSTSGNMTTTDFVTSEDFIWLPSYKELNLLRTSAGYVGESALTFNLFPTDASRIKYLNNGEGAAGYWWTRSPYVTYSTYFGYVITSGTYGTNNAAYSGGVCFGFCI